MATMGEKILDFLSAMNTHSRYPDSSRDEAYTRSYRVSRLVVGFLGILLPIIFIIGEALFLRGGVHVRGSLSEYYHTSMQDIFVGGLCVIGFLLATYMAGEARTWDFWASLIAGVAVLGVVFFPTTRSGLPAGAPACGSVPELPGCSAVEQALGEHQTAVIHAVFAIVFIFFLAVMSFLFAVSEVLPKKDRLTAPGQTQAQCVPEPGPVLDPQHVCARYPGRRGMGILGRGRLGIDSALHRGGRFCLGLRDLMDRGWIPPDSTGQGRACHAATQGPAPAAEAALPG